MNIVHVDTDPLPEVIKGGDVFIYLGTYFLYEQNEPFDGSHRAVRLDNGARYIFGIDDWEVFIKGGNIRRVKHELHVFTE